MANPRKPTALHKLEGTYRADRANPNEPQPAPLDDLTPPAGLDRDGKSFWNDYAPKLRRNGLLTEADVAMLYGLCDAWSQLQTANRALRRRKDPLTGAERRGAQADRKAARHDLRMFGIELGMSPAARGRLHITTGAPAGDRPAEDPMERLLSERTRAS